MDLLVANTPLDHEILRLISSIDSFSGRWTATTWLKPDILSELKRTTIITSSGSSTRIEGAKLSDNEIRGILKGLKITKLSSRDNQEVQGYIELLNLIFDKYSAIDITENSCKTLHKILLDHVTEATYHKGNYKTLSNHVAAYDAKTGEELGIIMETTEPAFTNIEMQKLFEAYDKAHETKIHPLLIAAEFILRFLKIHPFQDGNGRLSRALTNLFLMQSGYTFTQYTSHEKFIEDNKEDYYLALNKGQQQFQKNQLPHEWFVFFFKIIHLQIGHLSQRIKLEQDLLNLTQREKEILELARQLPRLTNGIIQKRLGYNPNTIKKNLQQLVKKNKLMKSGSGKGTFYTVI